MKNTKSTQFINQFTSGHQLVHQTQQYHIYNHKGNAQNWKQIGMHN